MEPERIEKPKKQAKPDEERREGLTFAETIEDHTRKELILAGLLRPH